MAVLKCKMCGGQLEISENAGVATCPYCDTQQTLPRLDDDTIRSLFNRANTLRLRGEFDKAESIYEKILETCDTEAEVYWGIILCKYGIEYVEDPKTMKRIPTCHRASYDAIVADENYKLAIAHADAAQKALYEAEAQAIDNIQKDILSLAKNEKPYDVFICYKETDENGHRTQDSVIANDIYYQLTQEGFKVFYAAITLEDKLGSAYEPYIFAALNSAKVMLVIGTRPEYFEAVWVKNEWSRYLKIIQKDRSKLLIPCYRDMDAYDLPEEFAHLQAQDMGKIGFISDVVRGIKKVLGGNTPQATSAKEPVITAATAPVNIAPLLKRAFMFLEDGEFDRADEFCEQVLNQDPENAQAYLGKLLAELKVRNIQDIADTHCFSKTSTNYTRFMRYASEDLKQEVSTYIQAARDSTIHEPIYQKSIANVEKYKNDFFDLDYRISQIQHSIEVLETIDHYKDAKEKIAEYKSYVNNLKNQKSSHGCYIATCVYGSYDCAPVWTLRRYRDNVLASSWFGRFFVHIYYACSPTLVKWFGNNRIFKSFWKKKLDRMVAKLEARGMENTPYQDKNW